MHVRDLVDAMECLAPTRFAEAWDNVGLLVGDERDSLSAVLLAIDLGNEQLMEAKRMGCEAIVAYHPPIFKDVRRLLPGMPAYEAVRNGVAVYSPHTALDVARGGTNDSLAEDVLGLSNLDDLRVADGRPGMGRIGILDPPTEREKLIDRVKARLDMEKLLVAGPRDGLVRVAAVCSGACGDAVECALERRAELYLTGEMRHHDALRASRAGMTVICTLHSNSERHVLWRVQSHLRRVLPSLEVCISSTDRDPFAVL